MKAGLCLFAVLAVGSLRASADTVAHEGAVVAAPGAPAASDAVSAPAPHEHCPACGQSACCGGQTPARSTSDEGDAVRVYGFIRPVVGVAQGAVESFSNPNQVAPTAAANPAYASYPDKTRMAFEVAQTRMGVWLHEKAPVRGHVEIDFVDFTKSTPTTATMPRLRIATVEWHPTADLTFLAGQDWDLVQPIMPHGLNFVGGLFEAGNTGFMRQQVRGLYRVGDFEFGVEAAMPGFNNTAKDGPLELEALPLGGARVQYNMGSAGRVGVSGYAAPFVFKPHTADETKMTAALAGLYGDVTYAGVNARFEGYWGQNIANAGSLGLSQGRANRDLREVGGYLSLKAPVSDEVSLYALGGGATVLNSGDVVPSYAYAGTVDPANPPALGAGALSGTGPGIKWNVAARGGVEVKVHPSLALAVEAFYFRTRFVVPTVDVARVDTLAASRGVDLGAVYTF